MEKYILTINGGSSSIRFALYLCDDTFSRELHGKIDRIGLPGTILEYTNTNNNKEVLDIPNTDFNGAIDLLKTFLSEHTNPANIVAIGHRIVHGMNRTDHALVDSDLIVELKAISPLDPEHMPFEIALLEMFAEWQPSITQVACFDTVFHRDMPRVAQVLPIPHRFTEKGVRKYGFHGLSCAFIMEELQKKDPEKANGKVIIAHLGNGASITAVKDGKSVDTSMGFTPTGGVPMSSRTGDIDPGALLYIMKKEGLSTDDMSNLVNHESGLLGVSETSSNMYDLLEAEASDLRAHDAVEMFCYEAKKRIGAYSTVLGGIDTIVFTGGMGENAPRIRKRICAGLEFLGITVDEVRNQDGGDIISSVDSSVCVRVIRTNEELMIARITNRLAK